VNALLCVEDARERAFGSQPQEDEAIFLFTRSTKNGTLHKLGGGMLVKRLPVAFYRLPSGREPVRDWLKALGDDDRKIVGEDVKDVEFSWPIACRCVARSAKGFGKCVAT
jgi:hypothetical protein